MGSGIRFRHCLTRQPAPQAVPLSERMTMPSPRTLPSRILLSRILPSRAPGSRRSFLAAVALAGTMLVAPAAAAAYTTAHPEGGTWYYGVSNGTVLSSYNHPSRSHRASVFNGNHYGTACTAKKRVASVSAPERPLVTDRAYYAFC